MCLLLVRCVVDPDAWLPLQFDSKAIDHYESDSDDVDESLTVPKLPGGEEVRT